MAKKTVVKINNCSGCEHNVLLHIWSVGFTNNCELAKRSLDSDIRKNDEAPHWCPLGDSWSEVYNS